MPRWTRRKRFSECGAHKFVVRISLSSPESNSSLKISMIMARTGSALIYLFVPELLGSRSVICNIYLLSTERCYSTLSSSYCRSTISTSFRSFGLRKYGSVSCNVIPQKWGRHIPPPKFWHFWYPFWTPTNFCRWPIRKLCPCHSSRLGCPWQTNWGSHPQASSKTLYWAKVHTYWKKITTIKTTDACLLLCVWFSFSVLSQEIGWEEPSPKWPVLCPVGRKTLTQSISRCWC